MSVIPILTLLAQAMMALPIVLPIFFAVLFCGVYLLLMLVNAVFALVNGFRRQSHRLLVSPRAMTIIAGLAAALICTWFLFSIDGRNT